MLKFIQLAAILFFCQMSFADNVIATWKTIDDETGEAKSHVEIFKATDGKIYGKIVKILDQTKQDEVCTKCTDYRKGKPMLGLTIIDGLTLEDGKYQNGDILDPQKGKFYDCKIWVEDGKLKVRGYIGFIYRTQTWELAD